MKKYFALASLLSVANAADAIVLQSSVLRFLDGLPYAIDGQSLFDEACLIKKIRDMQLGRLVDDVKKERVGTYTFRNKKYGVTALVELERQYENNKDTAAIAELQKILQDVKKEFITLTRPFMNRIEKQKPLILKLMVESCTRRGVPNSAMLNWGEAQFGHEEEMFNKSIHTLAAMNKFMTELSNFMGDIFQSCPKGFKQYEELIRSQRSAGEQKR